MSEQHHTDHDGPEQRIHVGERADGTPMYLPVERVLTGRAFLTGKSGSGKSNSASVVIEELLDRGFPVAIVDTDGEYYGLKEEYELLHAGADEECDIQVDVEHAEKLASLALEENVPIILDVSGYLDESVASELIRETARHLFAKEKKLKKPFLLVVEEVHEYIPEGGGMDDTGRMLVKVGKRGRKHGLGIVGISQRPADVKKDFITQANWLVWHRLTWNNDTKVVKRIVGSEYGEAVSDLDSGEAFLQADWTDEAVQRVQFRRKRTFDAGATPGLDDFERPELKSVSDGLMADLSEITERKEREEDRIEELEEKLGKKESRIQDLERELERARDVSTAAEQMADAVADSGSYRTRLGAKNDEIDRLHDRIATLEERIARLTAVGRPPTPRSAGPGPSTAPDGGTREFDRELDDVDWFDDGEFGTDDRDDWHGDADELPEDETFGGDLDGEDADWFDEDVGDVADFEEAGDPADLDDADLAGFDGDLPGVDDDPADSAGADGPGEGSPGDLEGFGDEIGELDGDLELNGADEVDPRGFDDVGVGDGRDLEEFDVESDPGEFDGAVEEFEADAGSDESERLEGVLPAIDGFDAGETGDAGTDDGFEEWAADLDGFGDDGSTDDSPVDDREEDPAFDEFEDVPDAGTRTEAFEDDGVTVYEGGGETTVYREGAQTDPGKDGDSSEADPDDVAAAVAEVTGDVSEKAPQEGTDPFEDYESIDSYLDSAREGETPHVDRASGRYAPGSTEAPADEGARERSAGADRSAESGAATGDPAPTDADRPGESDRPGGDGGRAADRDGRSTPNEDDVAALLQSEPVAVKLRAAVRGARCNREYAEEILAALAADGPLTFEAAADSAEVPPENAYSLLSALRARSLVTRDADHRYDLNREGMADVAEDAGAGPHYELQEQWQVE